jgi:hypothetical protein
MTSTHPPATGDQQVDEAPLINPAAAPPAPATPPVAVVERQSPLKRLLAAFGIGRIR